MHSAHNNALPIERRASQFSLSYLFTLVSVLCILFGIQEWIPLPPGYPNPQDAFWGRVFHLSNAIIGTMCVAGLIAVFHKKTGGGKFVEHPGSLLILIAVTVTLLENAVASWYGIENQITGVLDGNSIAGVQAWLFRWNSTRIVTSTITVGIVLIGIFHFHWRWRIVFSILAVLSLVQIAITVLQIQQFIGGNAILGARAFGFTARVISWANYSVAGGIIVCSIFDACTKSSSRRSWLHWYGVLTYLVFLFLPNILLAIASRYLSVEQIFNFGK